jgi:hypothetical protein
VAGHLVGFEPRTGLDRRTGRTKHLPGPDERPADGVLFDAHGYIEFHGVDTR